MTLKLSGVSSSQGNENLLTDINFEFHPGKIYVLIGRTNAGKTTLMRTIAGLAEPDEGSIQLNGSEVSEVPVWHRKISMVYQQFINYPNLNVLKNVMFPLLRDGKKKDEAKKIAEDMLGVVGLTKFMDRKPYELSGGQQQRVAIARALVRKADVLLMDEPLMNLDYKLREQLREEFKNLFRTDADSITLYATTEPVEALILGDEVLVMHEGKIIQTGAPYDVYCNPKNIAVAQVLNDPPMAILNGKISSGTIQIGEANSINLPSFLKDLNSGTYQVGIRPTDIHIGNKREISAHGHVTLVEVSGSETFVYLDSNAGPLILQIEGIHDYHIGQELQASFDCDYLFWFDEAGELIKPGKVK